MNREDKCFYFWQKWLTYANVLTIGIGFLVAFAGNSWVFDLHNKYTIEVFFNGQTLNHETMALKKLKKACFPAGLKFHSF